MDTSKIAGYAEMTAEEKLAALEAYEFDMTGYVKKEQFDKAASDTASWKKKYREKLNDEERKAQEAQEAQNALIEELNQLKADKQLSDTTAMLIAAGFESSLASNTAKAMIANDFATVVANQKKQAEAIEARVKRELMRNTPKPENTGTSPKAMTKEDFRKMSPLERAKFAQEHEAEYAALYQ